MGEAASEHTGEARNLRQGVSDSRISSPKELTDIEARSLNALARRRQLAQDCRRLSGQGVPGVVPHEGYGAA